MTYQHRCRLYHFVQARLQHHTYPCSLHYPSETSHTPCIASQGSGANSCVLRVQPELTTPAPVRITTRLPRTTKARLGHRHRRLLDMLPRTSTPPTRRRRAPDRERCTLSTALVDTLCNHHHRRHRWLRKQHPEKTTGAVSESCLATSRTASAASSSSSTMTSAEAGFVSV